MLIPTCLDKRDEKGLTCLFVPSILNPNTNDDMAHKYVEQGPYYKPVDFKGAFTFISIIMHSLVDLQRT